MSEFYESQVVEKAGVFKAYAGKTFDPKKLEFLDEQYSISVFGDKPEILPVLMSQLGELHQACVDYQKTLISQTAELKRNLIDSGAYDKNSMKVMLDDFLKQWNVSAAIFGATNIEGAERALRNAIPWRAELLKALSEKFIQLNGDEYSVRAGVTEDALSKVVYQFYEQKLLSLPLSEVLQSGFDKTSLETLGWRNRLADEIIRSKEISMLGGKVSNVKRFVEVEALEPTVAQTVKDIDPNRNDQDSDKFNLSANYKKVQNVYVLLKSEPDDSPLKKFLNVEEPEVIKELDGYINKVENLRAAVNKESDSAAGMGDPSPAGEERDRQVDPDKQDSEKLARIFFLDALLDQYYEMKAALYAGSIDDTKYKQTVNRLNKDYATEYHRRYKSSALGRLVDSQTLYSDEVKEVITEMQKEFKERGSSALGICSRENQLRNIINEDNAPALAVMIENLQSINTLIQVEIQNLRNSDPLNKKMFNIFKGQEALNIVKDYLKDYKIVNAIKESRNQSALIASQGIAVPYATELLSSLAKSKYIKLQQDGSYTIVNAEGIDTAVETFYTDKLSNMTLAHCLEGANDKTSMHVFQDRNTFIDIVLKSDIFKKRTKDLEGVEKFKEVNLCDITIGNVCAEYQYSPKDNKIEATQLWFGLDMLPGLLSNEKVFEKSKTISIDASIAVIDALIHEKKQKRGDEPRDAAPEQSTLGWLASRPYAGLKKVGKTVKKAAKVTYEWEWRADKLKRQIAFLEEAKKTYEAEKGLVEIRVKGDVETAGKLDKHFSESYQQTFGNTFDTGHKLRDKLRNKDAAGSSSRPEPH